MASITKRGNNSYLITVSTGVTETATVYRPIVDIVPLIAEHTTEDNKLTLGEKRLNQIAASRVIETHKRGEARAASETEARVISAFVNRPLSELFMPSVGSGYGKRTTTFTAPAGTPPAAARKLAEKFADDFENKCKRGDNPANIQTFKELADWYFNDIAPKRKRERVQEQDKQKCDKHFVSRFGNMKLTEINSVMLNKLFSELQASGSCSTFYVAIDGKELRQLVNENGGSRKMEADGVVSRSTYEFIANGERRTHIETAQKIDDYVHKPVGELFSIVQERQGMKQSSVATLRDLLSAIFTAAVKNKIVTENPVRSTEAIGLGEIQRSYLTKPQIVTFIKRLADVDNDSCKYLLLTALMTGLRSGELRALTWQDVNLDTAVLRVNKSVDNKGRVTPPKTKASNAAFRLNPRLADMLSYYKTSQQATFAALGITSDIMFPNTNGKFMTAGTPNIVLKKVIAGTDIAPDFHVHSLRHSFAHALFREGGNIKEVQQAMRHGRATVTQDIYLDAIEMLNDKLLNAPMKDIDNYALEAFTMPQLPLTA